MIQWGQFADRGALKALDHSIQHAHAEDGNSVLSLLFAMIAFIILALLLWHVWGESKNDKSDVEEE